MNTVCNVDLEITILFHVVHHKLVGEVKLILFIYKKIDRYTYFLLNWLLYLHTIMHKQHQQCQIVNT